MWAEFFFKYLLTLPGRLKWNRVDPFLIVKSIYRHLPLYKNFYINKQMYLYIAYKYCNMHSKKGLTWKMGTGRAIFSLQTIRDMQFAKSTSFLFVWRTEVKAVTREVEGDIYTEISTLHWCVHVAYIFIAFINHFHVTN